MRDEVPRGQLLPIDPHMFGNLGEDSEFTTGTEELFAGETKYLSARRIRNKRRLLQRLQPLLEGVLESDEKIAYLVSGMQPPRFLEYFGLGFWFYHLHPVVLVFTDRRLIEVLLDLRARPSTRIRSYRWGGTRSLKLILGGLKLVADAGKKQTWRLRERSDRKLLKPMLACLEQYRTQHVESAPATETHHWQCPSCFRRVAPNPASCDNCGTLFRTGRMATVLSLTFPGAGLFYAQRPILALLDLVGEFLLFGFVALMLALSTTMTEIGGVAGVASIGLFLTKLESVHISNILVRRARPITSEAGAAWRRFAFGGGFLSIAAIAIALTFAGSLVVVIQQDLEFSTDGWAGTRNANEFDYAGNETQRSQWNRTTGDPVAVFAYPSDTGGGWPTFRSDYLASLEQQGIVPHLLDSAVPGSHQGIRCVIIWEDADSEWAEVTYLVWEEETPAAHHVLTYADVDAVEDTLAEIEKALETSVWIPAVDPEH